MILFSKGPALVRSDELHESGDVGSTRLRRPEDLSELNHLRLTCTVDTTMTGAQALLLRVDEFHGSLVRTQHL